MNSPNRRRINKSPAEEPSQTSITDLPEAILLYIFSFLPTTAAIKTSAVARPWRHLWVSLPALDFNILHFLKLRPGRSDYQGRILFYESVTQSLRRRPRNFPIQKFKVKFFDYIPEYVDLWVRMLVDFEAAEIDLDFSVLSEPYEFRFCDIVNSSIKVLKLRCCTLSELCMNLNSIKELHLGQFMGGAGQIEQLMTSCLNLENFVLQLNGYTDYDFKIESKSLRHLTIISAMEPRGSNSVEICTPNLESIEFGEHCFGMYTLTDVSSLVEATVSFYTFSWWDYACWTNVVRELSGIERLIIYNNRLDDGVVHKTFEGVRELIEEKEGSRDVSKLKFGEEVFSETFAFHNLKDLTLKTWYSEFDILSLEGFLKKCPQLETMVLVRDPQGCRHLDAHWKLAKYFAGLIVLEIPRLREVKMEGYKGDRYELFVVELLRKHGVVLEKITTFPAQML